jgi:hypothetical protein
MKSLEQTQIDETLGVLASQFHCDVRRTPAWETSQLPIAAQGARAESELLVPRSGVALLHERVRWIGWRIETLDELWRVRDYRVRGDVYFFAEAPLRLYVFPRDDDLGPFVLAPN